MIKTPVNWIRGYYSGTPPFLVDDDGIALSEDRYAEACRRVNAYDSLMATLEAVSTADTWGCGKRVDIEHIVVIAKRALSAAKGGA